MDLSVLRASSCKDAVGDIFCIDCDVVIHHDDDLFITGVGAVIGTEWNMQPERLGMRPGDPLITASGRPTSSVDFRTWDGMVRSKQPMTVTWSSAGESNRRVVLGNVSRVRPFVGNVKVPKLIDPVSKRCFDPFGNRLVLNFFPVGLPENDDRAFIAIVDVKCTFAKLRCKGRTRQPGRAVLRCATRIAPWPRHLRRAMRLMLSRGRPPLLIRKSSAAPPLAGAARPDSPVPEHPPGERRGPRRLPRLRLGC
jgi:hypothetical protein